MAKTPSISRSKSPVASISHLARFRNAPRPFGGLLTSCENSSATTSIALPVVNFVPDYHGFINSLNSLLASETGLSALAFSPTQSNDWGLLPPDSSSYPVTAETLPHGSALDTAPTTVLESSPDSQPTKSSGSLAVDPTLDPVSVNPKSVTSDAQSAGPAPALTPPADSDSFTPGPRPASLAPASLAINSSITSLIVDSEPTVASASEPAADSQPAPSASADDTLVAPTVNSEAEATRVPPISLDSTIHATAEAQDLRAAPIAEDAGEETAKETPAASRSRPRKRKSSDVDRDPHLIYPIEDPTYDYSQHTGERVWREAPQKHAVTGWLNFTCSDVQRVFVDLGTYDKEQVTRKAEQNGWSVKKSKSIDDKPRPRMLCAPCNEVIIDESKTKLRHANSDKHVTSLATIVGFPLQAHKWNCESCEYSCRYGSESQHIRSHEVEPLDTLEPVYVEELEHPVKRLRMKSTPRRNKVARASQKAQAAGPSHTADSSLAAGPSHISSLSSTPGSPRIGPPPATPSAQAGPSGPYVPILSGLPAVRATLERYNPRQAEALMSVLVPARTDPTYAPAYLGYPRPAMDPSLMSPANPYISNASGNLLSSLMPFAHPSTRMPSVHPSTRIPQVPTPPPRPVQDAPVAAPREFPALDPSLRARGTPLPQEILVEEATPDQILSQLLGFIKSNNATANEGAGSDDVEFDFETFLQSDPSPSDS